MPSQPYPGGRWRWMSCLGNRVEERKNLRAKYGRLPIPQLFGNQRRKAAPPSHTRKAPSSRLLSHLSSPRKPCHAVLCVACARRGGVRGTLASAQGVFRGCASERTAIT
jgi:hypothetical protein